MLYKPILTSSFINLYNSLNNILKQLHNTLPYFDFVVFSDSTTDGTFPSDSPDPLLPPAPLFVDPSFFIIGTVVALVKLTIGRGINEDGIDSEGVWGVTPLGDVSMETMGRDTDM